LGKKTSNFQWNATALTRAFKQGIKAGDGMRSFCEGGASVRGAEEEEKRRRS
jgi:hypothetical protein